MSENQPKRFMLMFTIGPVQPFIEAARKTEDLWMGSYILSYLVATAMDKVKGDGVELIYPAIGSESPFDFWDKWDFRTPSFPNLFLAIGNGVLQDELVKRAECAENNVKIEFERIARCAVDAAFDNWRDTYAECVFNRQISDFFDVYWVITEETGADYGDWYAYTAGSLAAVKNCRAFKQTSEFGRKCLLDGTREILHKKEGKNEREQIRQAMIWWQDFAERQPKSCRQKEALCAVSLTKRMGRHFLMTQSKFKDKFLEEFSSKSLSFPSTSEVATASFKERLLCKPCALGVYPEFVKAVKKLRDSNDKRADIPDIQPLPKIADCLSPNIDGEWLYEETWDESYLTRYYNINVAKEEDQIKRCKQLRGQLVQLLEGEEPGKYYAAIAFDADNMGKVNQEAKNRKEHKERSELLIEYTKAARRIVEEEYLGKLTYAGGDDLLALANLKDLLPMLKKLRQGFPDFTSASAGVCIAHNKMPLGDVLRHARQMEKAAKNEGGRDALGIALFKHSGNLSQVVTKWENVFATGEALVELLRDNEVSTRFLYAFRATFTKLIEREGNLISGVPPTLVSAEFKRLFERAYRAKGKQLGEENQKVLSETIERLPFIRPFTNFLGFLEIITFIARGLK